MGKILVIKHGAFGDVVQTDGALRDIRRHHPDDELVVLTTPPYRSIFERCPHVDRVLTETRPKAWKLVLWWRLARMLRSERFDCVYDLQNSSRTSFYRRHILRQPTWICGERRRGEESPLSAFQRQLAAAGLETTHTLDPDVGWMAEDVAPILQARGVTGKYIVLIPGSSARHPEKRWPHYAALASAIANQTEYQVVTVPGPDEIELCRAIPATPLFDADDEVLDWFGLAGAIRGASYVVGNDTGPTHVAACLGKPGLALFGPHASPVRTGLSRAHFRAIEADDLKGLPVETVLREVIADLRPG
ncbi:MULTISPECIES: glycosyltransferase family 9 protein [unclassified Thioalkalivibrio]|uniref:glycosyltransferase family 9 protein n=1 Tax=unclassified Thioalkalivibrio TaxID=2621013 RepID=UPI0003759AD9|nr:MULTISPECIES: glycosyltransferase family 9 protein [unclassified Thioalkalivibrio]